MKTKTLAAVLSLVAAGAFSQGTVIFNNRIAGALITHVYLPDPVNYTVYQAGFGANDLPAPGGSPGSLVWRGEPLMGAGFTAQLWAAPGADQPDSALQPAFPTTTFRTGASAGLLAGTTATLTGVPADAPVATITLRVWDNQGGTIANWAIAVAAASAHGESPLFNLDAIGGTLNPAPALIGLQSFNFVFVPEPGTFSLSGLGLALLLLPRRRQPKKIQIN